ncbi:MAG: DEAD/DEAH box helicase domain-containing protein, partial [Planctomycetota bacterium]
ALFLYDRVQGGVGLAELLFRGYSSVLRAAMEVAVGCGCHNGCPACVGPPEEVGALGKETAIRILRHLVAGPELQRCEFDEEAVAVDLQLQADGGSQG